MKKTAIILCLVAALAFVACGCNAPSTPDSASTAAVTSASAASPTETTSDAPTAAPTEMPTVVPVATPATSSGASPADTTAKPMTIDCKIPTDFAKDAEQSTDALNVYYSDSATIKLGYEAVTAGKDTPKAFLKSILSRLSKEQNVSDFNLESSEADVFGSYPEYFIKWSTGDNEDTYEHEAHFILTDSFIYRVEFAVSGNSVDDETPVMNAFFKSVTLADSAS